MIKHSRVWGVTLLLLWLGVVNASSTKIYSWVDQQGNTHFTDAPPPGKKSKEIDLRHSSFVNNDKSVQVSNFDELTGANQRKNEAKEPLVLELLSPESGSTIRDNTGNVIFQADIRPKVPNQYQLQLLLNGKQAAQISNNLAIRLENLDRGAHEVQLILLGKDGSLLAKSQAITFYLHRTSLMAPARQKK